ncbi:PKD domain-containing protein [Truepera radiovictrix]|uniref:PKD domain containing protein n=1 Tax=Truepera radiovictrix (strain DSM 17093 / CIP 108686 / LMG 22925 / RQ-24) TaxID=649638 RepID=D7CTG0_TRURR|nr:PKD domain-containing protein [Truepera radiovictrix]ADI13817.1 PKD domain containing protein [Truepera radiovictrix DSM 17093]WMT57618.1 PKD domain-containing protein [Truepera radiovictrix]
MKRSLTFMLLLVLLAACGRDAPPEEPFGVALTADATQGQAPLTVNFSAAVPNADGAVGYVWDFGTGSTVQGSASRSYTFTEAGTYDVRVTATRRGVSASDTVQVTVAEAPDDPDNAPPVVELTASSIAGQAPLEVTFVATAIDPDGDPLQYSWNFGDGTTLAATSENTQTHRFERTGRFDVTVTVTDGRGGVAQQGLQIAVANPDEINVPDPVEPPVPPGEANRPPTVTLSGSTAQGPAPLTVSFNATASDPDGDPLTYRWNFGDGTTAEGNASQTVTYTEPGEYTASVVVSDGLAEARASFSVRVTEGAVGSTPPEVTVDATPLQGEAPLAVTFTATTDAEGVSFLWDFGDGTISSDNPARHTYRTPGSYTASVTVRNDDGVAREEVAVTVRPSDNATPPPSDIPFYGEWAWAARGEDTGRVYEGFVSVSRRTPPPADPALAESFVDGGSGAWTYCPAGIDACGGPTGLGFIDIVNYGSGDLYDIVFVYESGEVAMVAFDDDDTVGNEVGGAPTLMGGGIWFFEDGSGEGLSFAMVKIDNTPAITEHAVLEAARAELLQRLGRED